MFVCPVGSDEDLDEEGLGRKELTEQVIICLFPSFSLCLKMTISVCLKVIRKVYFITSTADHLFNDLFLRTSSLYDRDGRLWLWWNRY